MKNIITEDIIRNALNESIDEFIIEEEFGKGLKSWWNKPYMQTARNYVGKAYNGLKNAAAEYMNLRTNGQWNQKYGINPIYNVSQFSELRYLTQWFYIQKNTLQNILNPRSPSQISTDRTKINQYEDRPNDFIAKECTYQNFTKWAGQYIRNYKGLKFIDTYIYNYITKNYQDPQKAMQAMDLNVFLKTSIGNETYKEAAIDNNNRETTTNIQELQKEVVDISNFFENLKKLIEKVINNNVEDLPNFFEYNVNNYFNQYFKLYLLSNDKSTIQRLNLVKKYLFNQWSSWKRTIENDPSKAKMFKDWIDYNNFFNNKEGKQYWYLQRQTGAYGNEHKY